MVCFRGHTSENSRFVPFVHSFVWFGLRCVAVRWCCCARARPLVYVSGTQFLGIICRPPQAGGCGNVEGEPKPGTRALPSRSRTAQEPKLLIAVLLRFLYLLPCYHPFELSGVLVRLIWVVQSNARSCLHLLMLQRPSMPREHSQHSLVLLFRPELKSVTVRSHDGMASNSRGT